MAITLVDYSERDQDEAIDRLLVLEDINCDDGVPSRAVHIRWWQRWQEIITDAPTTFSEEVHRYFATPAERSPGCGRTTQYLQALKRSGYVETVGDERPRRYRLTAAGRDLLASADEDPRAATAWLN